MSKKTQRPPEPDPLLERVDALLRSHRDPVPAAAEVPVLTDVVDLGARTPVAPPAERDAVESLARELERSVMEQLRAELDRVIDERLSEDVLRQTIEQSLGYLRIELGETMRETVRQAVAAAVARALAARFPPAPPPAPEKRSRKR
jgi:AcrR family transcriptional regulator